MFRKIRIIGFSMLVLAALLVLTITPALAGSTATLSPHTISSNSIIRYWGPGTNWCNNVHPFNIHMHQDFASKASVESGYYTTASGDKLCHSTLSKKCNTWAWDGPSGNLKFYTKNTGSTTISSIDGCIDWSC